MTKHENRWLKERVFYWISTNTDKDAEHVSDHFGISGKLASDICEELLKNWVCPTFCTNGYSAKLRQILPF